MLLRLSAVSCTIPAAVVPVVKIELLHNLFEVSTDLFRYPGGPRQLLNPDAKSETMQSYRIVPPLLITTQTQHCKTHHNIHAVTNYKPVLLVLLIARTGKLQVFSSLSFL